MRTRFAEALVVLLVAGMATVNAQTLKNVRGVEMHRSCLVASDSCNRLVPVVSTDERAKEAYIDPRPLLVLAAPVTWSSCTQAGVEVICLFISENDLAQWNTLYSGDRNEHVAFVLDDHLLASVISRGPARNPIRLMQLDGMSPPTALSTFLENHSAP